tara:strand:+ start:189 stop:434 length:246 start_codon:yes stop_codon:yes gene_type:complete
LRKIKKNLPLLCHFLKKFIERFFGIILFNQSNLKAFFIFFALKNLGTKFATFVPFSTLIFDFLKILMLCVIFSVSFWQEKW